jgi:hypothetical protein
MMMTMSCQTRVGRNVAGRETSVFVKNVKKETFRSCWFGVWSVHDMSREKMVPVEKDEEGEGKCHARPHG